MFQNTLVLCAVIGFIAWYYFNKFQESEKEYCKLHKKYEEAVYENSRIKSRVKDLQSYKNDVSKTFNILDNELLMINDHLKRRGNGGGDINNQASQNYQQATYQNNQQNTGNRVSILTPDFLGTLFSNMNQERQTQEATVDNEVPVVNDQQTTETQPILASLTYEVQLNGVSPHYDRYLLDQQQEQDQATGQEESQ